MTFDEKLEALINQYLQGEGCGECCCKNVIDFYSTISVEDAIKYACDYGKVVLKGVLYEDSHYKKLDVNALKEAEACLLRIADKFKVQASFLDIYHLLRIVTEGVNGVNRMFYYDTSMRIAASVGKGNEDLLPKDVFYQRGAEFGARQLGILSAREIDEKKPYLPYKKFTRVSTQFKRLKPWQVEDFLCIFHDKLDFTK